jgi:uncharacterized protein
MTHPNEELVRRAFDAFASGDVEALRGLMDPDSVWHAPGRNPLAADYRGVEAILGYFARTMELTEGTFRIELHDVVANDEHAVSLFTARGQREGKTLDVRNVLVTHVRNGKLGEWRCLGSKSYSGRDGSPSPPTWSPPRS